MRMASPVAHGSSRSVWPRRTRLCRFQRRSIVAARKYEDGTPVSSLRTSLPHERKAVTGFIVEMSETANILNNTAQRSLVILDEITRGTGTLDGISLAWSIVEFPHNQTGAKNLFGTHYHELSELAG